MSYKLVIAEKSSVGKTIAKAIGATKGDFGFISGNGYIVSWCVGHLCDLAGTGHYDPKYENWRYEDLPIIPEKFDYAVLSDKKAQFDILKELMHRDDVTEIINACDAGREGERIFCNVYRMAGCKKPVKRLWISSMEDKAIVDGFKNLKSGEEYSNLYDAAECRAKADWLVGINLTRLLSTIYHRTLKCGRVMSPTLDFLVERDKEISDFTPEKYNVVKLKCDGFTPSSDRIFDEDTASIMLLECACFNAECREVTFEEKREKPPLLYDLTTLQRDANRIYGFTAQQTLNCAQQLYEKKLCTYPRTDSKYLTDDMHETAKKLLSVAASKLGYEKYTENTYQVCDGSKVSDHYAIVPTEHSGECDITYLPDDEKKIYELIARRLLCACATNYVYDKYVAYFDCGKYLFKYNYRKVVDYGWREYSKEKKQTSDEEEICNVDIQKGFSYKVHGIENTEGFTKPKAQYSEDTLLSAMENASAKEMPDDAERKGLGTPATRASIIEKLVSSGFVNRVKGKLIPTETGKSLIVVLPEALRSASLTAEWEHRLKNIEKGSEESDVFMNDIKGLVSDTVKDYTPADSKLNLFPSGRTIVGKCPRCGGNVTISPKGYFCETNDCRFGIWKDNKYLTPREICIDDKNIGTLLDGGRLEIGKIKSVKTGNYYPGILVMDDNGEMTRFRIELNNEK